MNSAKRIEKLINEMVLLNNKTTNPNIYPSAFEIFEKIFNVKGCINVAKKLKIVQAQVKKLEKFCHPNTYRYLNNIFKDTQININISNLLKEADKHLIAIHPMSMLIADDKIDNLLITELSEIILNMKIKIDNSNMDENIKEIIYSYIIELQEGINEIDLGGIDGLLCHIEIANGKVATYPDIFKKDPDIFNQVNEIYKKTTQILSDTQVWGVSIGYSANLLIGN